MGNGRLFGIFAGDGGGGSRISGRKSACTAIGGGCSLDPVQNDDPVRQAMMGWGLLAVFRPLQSVRRFVTKVSNETSNTKGSNP